MRRDAMLPVLLKFVSNLPRLGSSHSKQESPDISGLFS